MKRTLCLVPLFAALACSTTPEGNHAHQQATCTYTEKLDLGADGTVDRVWSLAYDADGHELEWEFNAGEDSHTVNARRSFYYDPDGRQVRQELDGSVYHSDGTIDVADGTPDSIVVYHHDVNGFVSWELEDLDADGHFDLTRHYVRDSRGNVITARYDGLHGFPDGITDYFEAYGYDSYNRMIAYQRDGRMEGSSFVEPADGTLDFWETWAFDRDGHLLVHDQDNDGDGRVDSQMSYAYAPDGLVQVAREDSDGDNRIDHRTLYDYDDARRLVHLTRDGGDNTPVQEEEWFVHDGEHLVLWQIDRDQDGLPDDERRYEYDAQGHRTMEELDLGADGFVESRTVYAYDALGHLVSEARDDRGPNSSARADGVADYLMVWSYDADGNVRVIDQDANGDKVFERRWMYSAPCGGHALPSGYGGN